MAILDKYKKLKPDLVRVIGHLPKYLRLYFGLLTDNRVSSKVKAILVTAIVVFGAQYFVGASWIVKLQSALSKFLGPLAFLPGQVVLLVSLDLAYAILDEDITDEHEKRVFGDGNSVATDLDTIRALLGESYDSLRSWWRLRTEKAELEMEKDGVIVHGEITDDALMEVTEQIVALETSEALQADLDSALQRLTHDDRSIEEVRRALLERLPNDGV
jgi:hypothetical protein